MPKKSRLRLVFYTDIHAKVNGGVPHALELAAEAINVQNPDLVIAGGDLISGGFTNTAADMAPRWQTYLAMQQDMRAEVYPVIGNHDLVAVRPKDGSEPSPHPKAEFCSRLGLARSYYSFDALDYHFIILDSIELSDDELGYCGFIGEAQMAWLRNDLSQVADSAPIVLVSHIPLATDYFDVNSGTNTSPGPGKLVSNAAEILAAFNNKQLILVLQGHLHTYEELRSNQTRFITGGAICGNWWRGPLGTTEEGFCVLTLAGNEIGCRYHGYGW